MKLSRRNLLVSAGLAASASFLTLRALPAAATAHVAGAFRRYRHAPPTGAAMFSLHQDKAYYDASGRAFPYRASRPTGAVGLGPETSDADWRRLHPFG